MKKDLTTFFEIDCECHSPPIVEEKGERPILFEMDYDCITELLDELIGKYNKSRGKKADFYSSCIDIIRYMRSHFKVRKELK